MEISPEVLEQLKRLEAKYAAQGQDLAAYLEGLYHASFLTYWDYIHLDTLLSLQNPRTDIPDEKIFIIYHQITELYFKLCLNEFEQLAKEQTPTAKSILKRIARVNRYFDHLTDSFDVMVDGMDQEQFLKFRMSLMPASGFQSVQFRMIEICATDLRNLMDKDKRLALGEHVEPEEQMGCIYWKAGATNAESGAKTLTLLHFEEKYTRALKEHAALYRHKNVWALYKRLPLEEQENQRLVRQLRALDTNVNVTWPLMHFKTAMGYLHRGKKPLQATGGTNWEQYLPPMFQKRIFYPELWEEHEIADWGKDWVEKLLSEI